MGSHDLESTIVVFCTFLLVASIFNRDLLCVVCVG